MGDAFPIVVNTIHVQVERRLIACCGVSPVVVIRDIVWICDSQLNRCGLALKS